MVLVIKLYVQLKYLFNYLNCKPWSLALQKHSPAADTVNLFSLSCHIMIA